MLSLLLLIVTNGQNSQKFQTSLYKILRNYLCDAKGLATRFHLSGHAIGFHLQTQKLELQTKQIVPCESTAEEVLFE